MDNLLAGYGSDSDESSSSTANKTVGTKSASISNLLGDGVDSCSSDDEDEVRKRPPSSSNANDSDVQTKKARIDENNKAKSRSFAETMKIPPPRIANGDQTTSLISWSTDYISQETPSRTIAPRQFEKFETLAASVESKHGLATHLRNQNKFHNPHFIPLVIEQLGIRENLGSQAVSNTKV